MCPLELYLWIDSDSVAYRLVIFQEIKKLSGVQTFQIIQIDGRLPFTIHCIPLTKTWLQWCCEVAVLEPHDHALQRVWLHRDFPTYMRDTTWKLVHSWKWTFSTLDSSEKVCAIFVTIFFVTKPRLSLPLTISDFDYW